MVNASLGRDMGDSKARAIQSWSQGTPVALGAGKKRRRENDVDSDEVLVSYFMTNCDDFDDLLNDAGSPID